MIHAADNWMQETFSQKFALFFISKNRYAWEKSYLLKICFRFNKNSLLKYTYLKTKYYII